MLEKYLASQPATSISAEDIDQTIPEAKKVSSISRIYPTQQQNDTELLFFLETQRFRQSYPQDKEECSRRCN